MHGAAAATDSTGSMTVEVESGRIFTPYLERQAARIGWSLFVLAPIDSTQRPDFCRHAEVIELPDTLVRVRVTDGPGGTPLSGAAVGVDNVGVRLNGDPPAVRGVVTLKAETGSDGSVEIPGLAPGLWEFHANTPQGVKHAARRVKVQEGASVVVDLAVVFQGKRTLP